MVASKYTLFFCWNWNDLPVSASPLSQGSGCICWAPVLTTSTVSELLSLGSDLGSNSIFHCYTNISPFNSPMEPERLLGATTHSPHEHHWSAFNRSLQRESPALPQPSASTRSNCWTQRQRDGQTEPPAAGRAGHQLHSLGALGGGRTKVLFVLAPEISRKGFLRYSGRLRETNFLTLICIKAGLIAPALYFPVKVWCSGRCRQKTTSSTCALGDKMTSGGEPAWV